jgi:hypothetical protein
MLRRELTRLREARKQKEDKLLNKKSLKSASHVKAAAKSFGDATIEEVDEVEINALDTAKKHKLKKLEEARSNRALMTQLNEYRSAVETLREQMTDMNLFNAKLLYVNKMLQSKDLTPKQQKVVIEAIDGAKTLREVKMLYKSLTESLTGGNGARCLIAAWHVHAALSLNASSSSASWHDRCRWAARQMLMRTASWHVHVRLARHAECAVRCTAHAVLSDECNLQSRRTLLSPP